MEWCDPCNPDHDADEAGGTPAEGIGNGYNRCLNLRGRGEEAFDRNLQKLTASREVPFLRAGGEQTVVTDTRRARRQRVEQEATDELVGGNSHRAGFVGIGRPILLVLAGL